MDNMAATTVIGCYRTTIFFPLSLSKPLLPSQNPLPLSKQQLLFSNHGITLCSQLPLISPLSPCSVSSPETSIVAEQEEEEEKAEENGTSPDDEMSPKSGSLPLTYRRSGQSMDEVVSGRGVRDASDGANDGAQSRKKKEGPRRFKR